nr:N-6 DNA methylase [uncultured Aquimonas sp.]
MGEGPGERGQGFATAAAKCCSSTPATSAPWSTARGANSPTPTSNGSPTPTTHGAALALPPLPSREKGAHPPHPYQDIPGFCKSATLDEIRKHGHVLTPGRYVGAEAAEDDGEAFTDKMRRLSAQWREQQQEAARLDAAIEANLRALGYGG